LRSPSGFATASLTKKDITMESVKKVLSRQKIHTERTNYTAGEIIRTVSDYYSIGVDVLKGSGRTQEVAMARQMGMYLTKNFTNLGLKAIGAEFGNKNHSTVLHGVKSIEEKIKVDEKVAKDLHNLTQILNKNS